MNGSCPNQIQLNDELVILHIGCLSKVINPLLWLVVVQLKKSVLIIQLQLIIHEVKMLFVDQVKEVLLYPIAVASKVSAWFN